jgi:hypothetical protein
MKTPNIPSGYTHKLVVRGVYYHPDQGLFLIQTEKSAQNRLWTTPGGTIDPNEGLHQGLIRLVFEDLKLIPTGISPYPFSAQTYRVDAKKELVDMKAFWINLPYNFTFGKSEGQTQTYLRFKFFPIQNGSQGLHVTHATHRAINSKGFAHDIAHRPNVTVRAPYIHGN